MNAFGASALSRSPMSGGLLSGNGIGGVRPPPAPPAPILPAITMSAYDPETGIASLTVNKIGTLYHLVDGNASRTAEQVKTGGGQGSGATVISSLSGSITIDLSSIPAGIFTLHLMLEDAEAAQSNVVSGPYDFPAPPAIPTLTNPIADQNITQNSGDVTFLLGTVFGGASTYMVSGAGATLDEDGVTLRLDSTVLRAGVTITATASNAGGSVSDTFLLTVAVASGATYTPVFSDDGSGATGHITFGGWTLRSANGSSGHINYISEQLNGSDNNTASNSAYTPNGTYTADQYMEVDIVSAGEGASVIVFANYVDPNNHYALSINLTSISIFKRIAGTPTTLVSTTHAGLPAKFRIDRIGNDVVAYINGVQVLTATDTGVAGSGKPGIGRFRGAIFDNAVAGNIT